MSKTFDYYADSHSFLARALLVMLSKAHEDGRDESENFYEELKARSNDFSEVKLTIQLNDLDVDAPDFMARLEKAMEAEVAHRVSERLEAVREITEVEDELQQLRDVLKLRVNQLADKYSIELYRED